MDYVIYTFGGGEALWKVFNGLALLFKSDSGFNSVMKLSLTVGAVWAAVRAMWGANVGIFARDYFIPTYLILNLMLIPTTSVHIIDDVNPDFRYSKVDNVPIGIAAVASTASRISKLLTNTLEHSLQTADANHYGKTGPLFAARLVSLAREIRIINPVDRQNMKDFVRQCFTLPFIWTNMLGQKAAALETNDILGFITANPHHWLGSYWRDTDGQIVFRHCREGAVRAKNVLMIETPKGLLDLASNLFGSAQVDSTSANTRLNQYFGDAWQTLSQQTLTAHKMAEQEMMMNTYREAVDDKRQEFGLDRLNPQLIAASSARAKFQQNSGFLVSAQMVGSMLPSLQSTMLAILCILFAIVVPMAMLPGGLKTLGMWVKLILWVESWPVFYAIINSVALLMASNRGAAYMSTGGGLSLLTQNGLADAAYDAYCYAEGFMAIVPVMAWAVISGGGYALANLSGTVTRSVDGLSSKLGSEITDGNVSFDNQNMHNRSIAGYQLAQQQLGSSFSYGQKYDDGRMNTSFDTQGNMVIQEAQTQLKTNVAGNDNMAASLTETAQESLQASHNYSKMASEQQQQGLNELASFAYQQSKAAGTTDTFGHTQTTGASQDFKQAWDTAEKISAQTGLTTDKVIKAGANLGVSSGGLFGKYVNIGASGDGHISASERQDMNKVKDTGLQNQLSESLSRGLQHSFDHKGSLSSQEQRQAVDSIQGSFNKAKSYQEQSQASLTHAQNFNKAASLVQSSGFSSTTNWNDQVLAHVADKQFGGDLGRAANWGSANPDAYRQEATRFMSEKQQPLIQALRSDHALSEDQIRDTFKTKFQGQIQNNVSHSDWSLGKERASHEGVGLEKSDQAHLQKQVSNIHDTTGDAFKNHGQNLSARRGQVMQGRQTMEADYNTRKEDGVFSSLGKKAWKEGSETFKDSLETAGRFGKKGKEVLSNLLAQSSESPVYSPSPQNTMITTPPLRTETIPQSKTLSSDQALNPKVLKEDRPIRTAEFSANPQQEGYMTALSPKQEFKSTDQVPVTPPSRIESIPLQSTGFSSSSQTLPQGETMPSTRDHSPQISPHEDYELSRNNARIADQGRQLKQVKEMMESSQQRNADEEDFKMPPPPMDK